MNIVGSSIVDNISSGASITGPTGPTGPSGPTGPAGYGATGSTGNSIIGITLIDHFIMTTFTDGTTYATPSQAIGKTGAVFSVLGVSNIGDGISLGHSILNGMTLITRSIVFEENENSKYIINSNLENTGYNISLITNSSGITLIAGSSANKLLKFNSKGKAETISNTSGNTFGVSFSSANIFELVRGGGWTGSTGGIYCVGSTSGITCTLDPTISEFDTMMRGSRSHVYVTNFRGSTASIVVVDPPNDKRVYGFDLFLRNALNPVNISDRFSSNIKWSMNRAPCFSFSGTTCDMKISFFGLGGSTCWYASAISIPGINNKTCPGISLFDADCSGSANLMSGSSVVKQNNDIGACCNSEGNCEETYAKNCSGFFHGIGTTCGNVNNSICNKIGACCIYTSSYSCYDYLTCTECLALGYNTNITKFGGNFSKCVDIDCINLNNIYFNFL